MPDNAAFNANSKERVKDNIFAYHEPFEETQARYVQIRALAKEFSALVDVLVPDSREASLAQTKIEEAVMWANAGIARNVINGEKSCN